MMEAKDFHAILGLWGNTHLSLQIHVISKQYNKLPIVALLWQIFIKNPNGNLPKNLL